MPWRRDRLPTPILMGFPGGSDGKESACQCRRHKKRAFSPWLGRSLEKEMVFLPRKFHEQRSLAGYSPWDCKESDTAEWLSMHTC